MIYLDTSAAVPLFVPEPSSDRVVEWLGSCTEVLASSDWIMTEFASALSIKVRRGELAQRHAKAAWDEFEGFCRTGLRLVPVTRIAFARAAELVRSFRSTLRAGDSLHLAMAMEIGAASLATADRQLENSATAHGLVVNRF